jgi:hypothetical protein
VSSWIASAKTVASSGRDRDLPLGQDPDERRRERPVVGDDHVLGSRPLRRLARVMVEDDLLDVLVQSDLLELAQTGRVDGLNDDQAVDRVRLEPRGLDHVELVGVQPVELAHVAVERAGQRRDRRRGRAGARPASPRRRRSPCSRASR